jgi:hypothetical protein
MPKSPSYFQSAQSQAVPHSQSHSHSLLSFTSEHGAESLKCYLAHMEQSRGVAAVTESGGGGGSHRERGDGGDGDLEATTIFSVVGHAANGTAPSFHQPLSSVREVLASADLEFGEQRGTDWDLGATESESEKDPRVMRSQSFPRPLLVAADDDWSLTNVNEDDDDDDEEEEEEEEVGNDRISGTRTTKRRMAEPKKPTMFANVRVVPV